MIASVHRKKQHKLLLFEKIKKIKFYSSLAQEGFNCSEGQQEIRSVLPFAWKQKGEKTLKGSLVCFSYEFTFREIVDFIQI